MNVRCLCAYRAVSHCFVSRGAINAAPTTYGSHKRKRRRTIATQLAMMYLDKLRFLVRYDIDSRSPREIPGECGYITHPLASHGWVHAVKMGRLVVVMATAHGDGNADSAAQNLLESPGDPSKQHPPTESRGASGWGKEEDLMVNKSACRIVQWRWIGSLELLQYTTTETY